jgi:hypothetical protein
LLPQPPIRLADGPRQRLDELRQADDAGPRSQGTGSRHPGPSLRGLLTSGPTG